MSFLEFINSVDLPEPAGAFNSAAPQDVEKSLEKDRLGRKDLLNLLSPAADPFLEQMAVKANRLTRQYFGKTIGLYAPLYISDYCSNHCAYCGFKADNDFPRRKLGLDEIEREADILWKMGIRHVLVLTGEAPDKTPMDYLLSAVDILKRFFASISIEMFPMETESYARLKEAGVDGLVIYQEVYDREIYRRMHPAGRKRDYDYRLLTPERGAAAGFRSVGIGALLGLGNPSSEAFMTAMHARYLERKFPETEISLSLPRMTRAKGAVAPAHELSDRQFVKLMVAFRLFLPRAAISISTREHPDFRKRLMHLGATRFSAGSRTEVGGYSKMESSRAGQFETTDKSSVEQVVCAIRENGFQPVFKDWEIL